MKEEIIKLIWNTKSKFSQEMRERGHGDIPMHRFFEWRLLSELELDIQNLFDGK